MKYLVSLMAAVSCIFTTQAVTLNVSVPNGTQSCYVAGDFNGWDAGNAVQLTKDGTNHFTIDLPDVTTTAMAKGYKYLSGPGWDYVEKGANGEEISNRTSVGSNDVVASWAKVYTQNANLKTTTIKVNGYDRKVEILLPTDYETTSESYPVVYYLGVKQRYSNAGSDSYAGDDLFAYNSWNVPECLPADLRKSCIFVASSSFVAENIPWENPEFKGSGQSEAYLADFIAKVVPYINSTYRTEKTYAMGADLGGVLSLYAAIKHPEVFNGGAISMSPMLWIAPEMTQLAQEANNGNYIIMAGSKEPQSIQNDAKALAQQLGASYTTIGEGVHNEESWSGALPVALSTLLNGATPPSMVTVAPRYASPAKVNIAETEYQLYSAVDTQTLNVDNTATFSLVNDFISGGNPVQAQVLVRDIPVSVKTKYYWNVARLPGGEMLLSSPRNVSFSSKKNSVSWHRVAILSDETVKDIAASSTAFTLQNSAGKTTMTIIGDHRVKATVDFPGSDKSYTVHYGSVNSGSDMGAITSTLSVSASCTQATIEYNFLTNNVTVTETSWGDVIDKVKFAQFSAVPSITTPGSNSHITIVLDEPQSYSATLTSSVNYGTPTSVALTQNGTNSWSADLSNLKEGIYHLSLNLQRGTASKTGVAEICIKVTNTSRNDNQVVSVNAYKNIDWESINRYKANFHTHTSQSFDTEFNTSVVVDRYKNAGYKILALTDHDANPYPWNLFDLYNPESSPRDSETLGMLAIPGVELSKDNRNNWSESTGGEFNHHNDFFTGRKGQEFASLRESYAYTMSLGGMQIINHPGQYWSLDKDYTATEKNSPGWHVENFRMFPSLVGLEVYNQGNRRPNDRVLWDQILDRTMPERPVWGYSCDDTHTTEQYFRNYQYMLMPDLTVEDLKEAMAGGHLYFSYEYTGSGNALAPNISSIDVDNDNHTITVETDAPEVFWIAGTDRNSSVGASSRKSSVVGMGKTFNFNGFKGTYVRALLRNDKGETCTQPFGFADEVSSSTETPVNDVHVYLTPNPASETATIYSSAEVVKATVYSMTGVAVIATTSTQLNVSVLSPGAYIVVVETVDGTVVTKLIRASR